MDSKNNSLEHKSEYLHFKTDCLSGKYVRLEPFNEAIRKDVRIALDCDNDAWKLNAVNGQGEYFDSFWESIIKAINAGHRIGYAIRNLGDGKIVGTSSFLNIKPERQVVEIGGTFLHPSVRSGYVNPESKLLMLQYAFQNKARRVELITDIRNERSQAAIAKLGAIREGVMRRDRITWTGHIRDSVLYSITDIDWKSVEEKLKSRLC